MNTLAELIFIIGKVLLHCGFLLERDLRGLTEEVSYTLTTVFQGVHCCLQY